MKEYLEASEYIDWQNAKIKELASSLSLGLIIEEEIAKNCFEWVRDSIRHSSDYKLNPVTCKASDVLSYKTGYCYAKSHLLVALLRANSIPAGLCYQRLSIEGDGAPYCLHGLTAVHLKRYGWYRIDPRGNKNDIKAEFIPPQEKIAFQVKLKGEANLPEILSVPLPSVVRVLEKYKSYEEVFYNLPDIARAS